MSRDKLSYKQKALLDALAEDPNHYAGSCSNPTMCALEKKGLAKYDWNSLPIGWRLTEAGLNLSAMVVNQRARAIIFGRGIMTTHAPDGSVIGSCKFNNLQMIIKDTDK
jgi:hypothetical protein